MKTHSLISRLVRKYSVKQQNTPSLTTTGNGFCGAERRCLHHVADPSLPERKFSSRVVNSAADHADFYHAR